MAKTTRKTTRKTNKTEQQSNELPTIDLGTLLSEKPAFQTFKIWLVGDTPLICHAWSEKARREMLQKQVKATKTGKEARDPQDDFVNSLYVIDKNAYGFPVTGIKNAILSCAHKDKGIPRSVAQSALYLDADMVRTRPALTSAICDMPLVRIFGSAPEMREDMVRIGTSQNKTANLAYRGQFTTWAICVTGKFNPTVLTAQALAFLVSEAGIGIGIGEWRNEKKGMFGAFHIADAAERAAWERFASGKGALPTRNEFAEAAE